MLQQHNCWRLVCVLFGRDLPVVLREIDNHFVHVGLAFVVGLMDGEAMANMKGVGDEGQDDENSEQILTDGFVDGSSADIERGQVRVRKFDIH